MLYPKNLEKGYQIGVTATSAGCDGEVDLVRLESGINHFKELGYSVEVTENVQTISQKGRSSDARTRAKELEELFSNTRVRAVITYNGGDYLVEMLSFVNFDLIKANPKWVQGYSDTTGLTFVITTNCDIATLYAENFSSFGMKNWHYSLENNIKILEGQDILQESFSEYQDAYHERITGYEEYFLDTKVQWKNIYPANDEKTDEINIQG
ncbi:MAG: LD-carboxypeptidase, partial [Mobilitalea sp.]